MDDCDCRIENEVYFRRVTDKMSIHVTVNSHPVHVNRGKMLLSDVETEKMKEWNRRRKLRIQQVRQQSKDLAHLLRQKVKDEQCRQQEQFEKVNRSNIKAWQKKKLDSLTEKYNECLKDVGRAHIQAASQPDAEEVLKEERLRNSVITGARGASALNHLRKEQQSKLAREAAPLRQLSMTRAKEDLRASMVASLPRPSRKSSSISKKTVSPRKNKLKPYVVQEIPSNLPDGIEPTERVLNKEDQNVAASRPKTSEQDSSEIKTLYRPLRQKEANNDSGCYSCRCVPPVDLRKLHCHCTKRNTSRIQCSATLRRRRYSDEGCGSDSEASFDSDTTWPPRTPKSRRSKSSYVETYDHDNRHSSRTIPKSYVKKIDQETSSQKTDLEMEKRELLDRVSHTELNKENQVRRGNAALQREHMRNDFNRLLAELGKLSREERRLRCMNQVPVPTILGETQRKMNMEKRQKKLNSAFESDCIRPSGNGIESSEEMPGMERKESSGTPKLNVGDWKPSDPCATILQIEKQKQKDKLTLTNLMQRINNQREILFKEIRKGRGADEKILSPGTNVSEQNTKQSQDVTKSPRAEDKSPQQDQQKSPQQNMSPLKLKEASSTTVEGNKFPTEGSCSKQMYTPQNKTCFCTKNDIQSMGEHECLCGKKSLPESNDLRSADLKSPVQQQQMTTSFHDIEQSQYGENSIKKEQRNTKLYEKTTAPETTDTVDANSLITDDNVTTRQRNRRYGSVKNMRFPSPILEASREVSTSPKSNLNVRNDDGNNPEQIENEEIIHPIQKDRKKVQQLGENNKILRKKADIDNGQSESSTSLSTLYSLDMALSRIEQNDSTHESTTSLNGLRITVKVSGHKKLKNKKRKKKDEKQIDETCKKLLEDTGNMRKIDISGGTSSTSYRSPPEHLSPNQLSLLNSLLQQIEDKGHKKGIPLLKQYIVRLLAMSRESVDRLGVSSSDVSLQSSLFQEMVETNLHNINESMTSYRKDSENVHKHNLHRDEVDGKYFQRDNKGCQVNVNEPVLRKKIYDDSSNTNSQEAQDHQHYHQQHHHKQTTHHEEEFKPYQGLDNFDVLTEQVKKYFENKNTTSNKSDEIVSKYTELARRYAERISNLADMIGDLDSDVPESLIKKSEPEKHPEQESNTISDPHKQGPSPKRLSKSPIISQGYNETSYMSLPPEVTVPMPAIQIEGGYRRVSPTFCEEDQHNVSWHESLSQPLPTNISPAPDVNQWFRPRPPPTILNNHNNHKDVNIRMCSPHELSTILEVDTPSTSHWHDKQQQPPQTQRSSCKPYSEKSPGSYSNSPRSRQSPAPSPEAQHLSQHSPRVVPNTVREAADSFFTLKSDEEDDDISDRGDENVKNICDESFPDIMQELIRRKIITSPFGWAKELDGMKNERDTTEQLADEEVRQIFQESPEDLESAFQNLGMGWASTTLRKTRQAEELSADSSSPLEVRKKNPGIETSTPQSGKVWPVVGSETELSAVRLIASSSSDLALTPPDISLAPPRSLFPSDNSLS